MKTFQTSLKIASQTFQSCSLVQVTRSFLALIENGVQAKVLWENNSNICSNTYNYRFLKYTAEVL